MLFREVLLYSGLLSADGDSGTIIAEVVQSEASAFFASEPAPGKRVGAYRILREIGRGGMGAVYGVED
jgi:hypothetical protein